MTKKTKKIYVITGSTSGIGYELLKRLSDNSIIFAGYRNEEKIKKWEFNENVIPFYMDMTDSNSIKSASEFIKSKVVRIDTLINVAGCVVAGAVEEIDIKNITEFIQKMVNNLFIVLNITNIAQGNDNKISNKNLSVIMTSTRNQKNNENEEIIKIEQFEEDSLGEEGNNDNEY